MSEIGDIFVAIGEAYKDVKRKRVIDAPAKLMAAGIKFEVFNEGQHLRVQRVYDFWPSTGLFIHKVTKRRKTGIDTLIREVRNEKAGRDSAVRSTSRAKQT